MSYKSSSALGIDIIQVRALFSELCIFYTLPLTVEYLVFTASDTTHT